MTSISTHNRQDRAMNVIRQTDETERAKQTVEPELQPAPAPDLLSAPDTSQGYASAFRTTKGKQAQGHKTDGRKQAIDRQISALYAAIQKDMPYIENMIRRHKNERAIARMRWVVERHDQIAKLSRKWETIKAQAAVDKVQGPKPPVRIHSTRKRKVYPTWSNK